ncbi:hypothetical protein [uncultured Bdellovibrio sp.]|uniref:hypothetical protein n=1 Tax=Bdellovibrio sp. HCB-162 TaxID=3394234 RepID=UPI0025D6DAF1|nr:hypothetical protein [uncultured Bdellovibrio sp.]
MSFAIRPLLGILATVLLAGPAFANNNASVTSSLVVQQPKKEGRLWSGYINVGRSASLYDFKDGSRKDGMDYALRFNLKASDNYTVRIQGGYSQDLKYPESDDFSDTSVSVIRSPFEMGSTFLLGYRIGAVVPTSKDSHVRQNLTTSVSTALNVIVNPDRLITGFDVSGSISAARNIHQYETALDGRVNTQYSSNQSLSLSYSWESGVSLSADFLHRNTWSYQNVMRDSFEMSQELGYQFNPTWAFAVGHTNSGSTLKPNGSDSNVQFIDENNSLVYASMTVIF